MPSGYPLVRHEQNLFVREFPEFAGGCRDWIDWIAHERNIEIQSAFHGGEKRIGKYKVGGYCQEQNNLNSMVITGMPNYPSFQTKMLSIPP